MDAHDDPPLYPKRKYTQFMLARLSSDCAEEVGEKQHFLLILTFPQLVSNNVQQSSCGRTSKSFLLWNFMCIKAMPRPQETVSKVSRTTSLNFADPSIGTDQRPIRDFHHDPAQASFLSTVDDITLKTTENRSTALDAVVSPKVPTRTLSILVIMKATCISANNTSVFYL